MGAVGKFAAVVLAAAVIACGWSQASDPGSEQVKVEVASVGVDDETGAHYVLLADESGKKTLPIMIGENEARAILLELHGIKAPRPLTYDLLRNVIEQTGNHVDRVVIGELREETYFATIELDRGRYRVDSRPSDAIALALGANAPIFVADRLFENAPAIGAPQGLRRIGHALGLTVQELTPELAEAFAEQPHSGVLVSAADNAAASAGIRPGDIVTSVGSTPVKSLKDFSSSVAELKPGDSVQVSLKRSGAPQSATLKVPAPVAEEQR
jgi:bifunctional DNase/RNase